MIRLAILEENQNIKFSSGKRWFKFTSINGNLSIEYKFNEKIYVITRIDDKPFDGKTEWVGAKFLGNMKEPETLDEVIDHEVNLLTSAQIEPEVSMFNEFDWSFNEDKTEIRVYPVFLDKSTNIVIALPEPFGSNVELSCGTVKTVRNSNIKLDDENTLGLRKK